MTETETWTYRPLTAAEVASMMRPPRRASGALDKRSEAR